MEQVKTEIRTIPRKFIGIGEVRGLTFKRIKKSKNVYLYEVDGSYYEVFRSIFNRRYKLESYPYSPQFGKTAYTELTLDSAMSRFKKLTKQYK